MKIKSKQVNRQLSKRHSFRISSGCWKSLISNHWNRLYTHARTVRRPNAMFPNIIQISRLAKTVIELVRIKKDREKQRERGLFLSNPPLKIGLLSCLGKPYIPLQTHTRSHTGTLTQTQAVRDSQGFLEPARWVFLVTVTHKVTQLPNRMTTADVSNSVCKGVFLWEATPETIV